jgi:hypothetical protein
MRRLRTGSLASALLVVGAVGSVACVTSSDTPPPQNGIDFDSGTFDAGGSDANVPPPPDAGTDAGDQDTSPLPDAAPAPAITLTASSTNVTAQGLVTITATVTGATATSVAFAEGATALGTATAAPFVLTVPYSYFENGTHTYVATATLAGGATLASAPLVVTVLVPANGQFVDPTTGLDTNPGTQAAPLKTIAKAAQLVTAGQTIYLGPGTYDSTNQSLLTINFPNTTLLRAITPNTVVIKAPGAAFTFPLGGGVQNVAFQGFTTAMNVNGASGTFVATGVSFSNVGTPLFASGGVSATVDLTGVTTPIANVPASAGAAVLWAEGTATVNWKGGTVDTVTSPVNAVFTRAAAKVTVDGLTIKHYAGHAIVVFDNANVTLKNVTLDDAGLGTSGGADKACIAMGGQNTQVPQTPALSLDTTSITASRGNAIALSVYANLPETPTLTFLNSHLDGSVGGGSGLLVSGIPPLNAAQTVTIKATNTTFTGNQAFGIVAPRATVDLSGGDVSNNGTGGLQVTDMTSVNAIKVRKTTFGGTGGNLVTLAGTAASVLDLGKTGDLGGIVFTNVGVNFSAVRLDAPVQGFAIGNTWIPSQQGADATGKYVTPTTLMDTAGLNGTINAGASLVVAQ